MELRISSSSRSLLGVTRSSLECFFVLASVPVTQRTSQLHSLFNDDKNKKEEESGGLQQRIEGMRAGADRTKPFSLEIPIAKYPKGIVKDLWFAVKDDSLFQLYCETSVDDPCSLPSFQGTKKRKKS